MSFRFSFLLTFFILLAGLFFLTRVYRIDQSLLYFNDMGRDSSTLLDWSQTGKPPLLGPQTSALPFNQTAGYFYLLYPAFLLFHHSAFSAIYTLLFFYLALFGGLIFLVRKNIQLVWLLCCVFFLVIIHPQFIIQNRFVWNPSFEGPLIVASFIAFYQYWKTKTLLWEVICAFALALALSLNYSVLPAIIAFCLVALVILKWKAIHFYLTFALCGFIINFPTLVFELRHHFLLTTMLLTRPRLPQSGVGFSNELFDLIHHSLHVTSENTATFTASALVILFLWGFFWYRVRHQGKNGDTKRTLFHLALGLFTLTTIITLLTPVSIQAHYIFAVLTLGLITICLLPLPLFFIIFVWLVSLWLPPLLNGLYYQPALRTVTDLQTCYRTVCATDTEPLFVSVQAGFHPYHNGPEHRFLMREAGCQVVPIETQPNDAQYMAVVVDNSVYQHGKTSYNELSTFGPSSVQREYDCPGDVQVEILKKLEK